MSDINDEKILERAQEIKADRGVSLTDAMLIAEGEMKPKAKVPESFDVTIKVKPRVAKWIMSEFSGHPKFTLEERLGATLATYLSRSRVRVRRMADEGGEIQEGKAVTLRRDVFKKKAPTE